MMKTLALFLAATALVVAIAAGCSQGSATAPPDPADSSKNAAKKTMRPFRSERELKSFFREIAERRKRAARRAQAQQGATANSSVPVPAPAQAEDASVAKSASGDKDESVTNVQTAGVDEGGIVKLHGDYLVVLRRGRLFTVAIGDGALKPVSTVDAFGPDLNPSGAWYDEMLISEDTIAVIGYSYERGGTEVGLFRIDSAGGLSYLSTYHLRSNDYYSSRNYASRLIGSKLIFYTPLYLSPEDEDPFKTFPAVRRWHKGAKESEFRPITEPTRVYRPEGPVRDSNNLALHTVTVCDIDGGDLSCKATAVVGAPGRVFYVSGESVYVWTSDWSYYGGSANRAPSMLYRMPLDGSGPSALRVSGSPVDQFSFLESGDGQLNVLVRSEAAGDGMWGAEVAAGDVALMRVPLDTFSDGSEAAPSYRYRKLPKPEGYTFQNRFVGKYLLYGTGSGWGQPQDSERPRLYATRWDEGGEETAELKLAHGVDRIEVMGSGAVVVGTDGRDLHFTSVRLGDRPGVAGSYVREGASQGELRSHGFFYKSEGEDRGLLGLPVRGPGRPGYEHLFNESASILFLRNESMRLSEVGDLTARPEGAVDDGCRASCVDWYGNARPLFVRGRVFALLGYEIVEGNVASGRIRETRRASFAPRRAAVSGL